MSKQSFKSASQLDVDSLLKSAKGETLGYTQVFEQIRSLIPSAEVIITTTLPRGSLQIAQPQRLPEQILRSYSRDFHALDRLTWRAIEKGKAVRAADCWNAG